jgi:biotin carboxyl carrier protein
MRWKVHISNQTKIVNLPDQIPDNVPFDATIDGVPVKLKWQRQTKLLLVQDKRVSDCWTSINLRSKSLAKFPGESELNINVEFTKVGSKTPIVTDATLATHFPGQEARAGAAAKKPKVIRSQITGKVLKVFVKAGDQVASGDTLMIIEAMKMENRVQASTAGILDSVKVNEGETVASGAELVRYKQG